MYIYRLDRSNDNAAITIGCRRTPSIANVIRRLTFNETLSSSPSLGTANPRSCRRSFLIHLPSEKSLAERSPFSEVACRGTRRKIEGKMFPGRLFCYPAKCKSPLNARDVREKNKSLEMTDRPAVLTSPKIPRIFDLPLDSTRLK